MWKLLEGSGSSAWSWKEMISPGREPNGPRGRRQGPYTENRPEIGSTWRVQGHGSRLHKALWDNFMFCKDWSSQNLQIIPHFGDPSCKVYSYPLALLLQTPEPSILSGWQHLSHTLPLLGRGAELGIRRVSPFLFPHPMLFLLCPLYSFSPMIHLGVGHSVTHGTLLPSWGMLWEEGLD